MELTDIVPGTTTGLPKVATDQRQASPFPDAAPAAVSVQPKATVRRAPRPTVQIQFGDGFERWGSLLLDFLLSIGMTFGAYLLWRTDGIFTITFLSTLFPSFAAWGLWQWSVPVFFTLLVVGAWPRTRLRRHADELREMWEQTGYEEDAAAYQRAAREIRTRWNMVIGGTILNMGTSLPGVGMWLKASLFPTAVTLIPWQWGILAILSGIFVYVLGFGPERIVRWSIPKLISVVLSLFPQRTRKR